MWGVAETDLLAMAYICWVLKENYLLDRNQNEFKVRKYVCDMLAPLLFCVIIPSWGGATHKLITARLCDS